MDETVAVRNVMDRSYVGVSESDTVAGTAALMREEGVDSAVVLRGNEPVGLLLAVDVVAVVAEGRDPGKTPVGEVMTRPVPTVDADSGLADVVGSLANDDVGRAVVMESGAVVGVLSGHDLVAAHATMEPPEAADAAPVDVTALQSGEYATQGVCEICGALSRALTDRNGQLVCADCLEM